jgi:hypothetical protein
MRSTVIVNYNTRVRVKRFFGLFCRVQPASSQNRTPLANPFGICTYKNITTNSLE